MHAFDLAPVFLLGRTRVVELLVPDALQAERTIALYEQPLKARTLVLPDLEVLRECGECHVLILARGRVISLGRFLAGGGAHQQCVPDVRRAIVDRRMRAEDVRIVQTDHARRTEERRGGKDSVSTCKSRWGP